MAGRESLPIQLTDDFYGKVPKTSLPAKLTRPVLRHSFADFALLRSKIVGVKKTINGRFAV